MNGSIWHLDTQIPQFPTLDGDRKTDVLIIGGGLTGILCAVLLAAEGIDYTLIEANRLMHGVSGLTTAKITSQHGSIYHKLLKKYGPEKARAYWEMNEEALRRYAALSRSISCDFEMCDHAVYSTHDTRGLETEMNALRALNIPASLEAESELPFAVQGIIRFQNQGRFHPLKFVSGLVPGLHIYENTKAIEFLPGAIRTNQGVIWAKKFIVATHFPILNKHGGYFLKLYQNRSYVRALSGVPRMRTMYLDIQENGLSFRNHGDYLLLGGGGHRTGKQGGGWRELEEFSELYYPEAREICRWATQDCMSLDSIPYVGQYSSRTPDLLVASGYHKWGMTSSMAAAQLLTDMILGRENLYINLLKPDRSILHGQLLGNLTESVVNLLKPTAPRCPHLGCALKWNPEEHSWDCPCHGSRFNQNGELLEGPATDDKK